jgi:pimeloyl-ACP methyl ester carboxylesterase
MTIPIVSYTPPSGTALGGFPLRTDPYTNITPFTIRDGLTYLETLEELSCYVNQSIIPYIDANYTALQGAWDAEVADIVNSVNAAIDSQLSGATTSIQALVDSVNALTPQINAAVTAAGTSATNAAASASAAATSAGAASTSAGAASTSAGAAAASVTSSGTNATNAAGSATAAASSASAAATSAANAAASAAAAGTVNGAQVVKAGMAIANTRSKMHYMASADAARSRGNARVPFDDVVQVDETFASLAAWSSSALVLSSGKVGGVSSPSINLANRALSLLPTEEFRLKTAITLVAGGASTTYTLVGVNGETAGIAPAGADLIGIGFRNDGYIYGWRGTSVGGANAFPISANALSAGTWYVTVVVDANTLSFSVTSADGLGLYEYTLPRSTLGAVNNVWISNSDARGAAGNLISPIHWRRAITWNKPRTGNEGFAPEINLVQDANGQLMRVVVPANYDPRVPAPLIIMTHGAGRDQSQMSTTTAQQTVLANFLAAGYIVASHNQHGSNWGNPIANDDVVALYQWVIKRYAIQGAPFIWTHSMGALSALNLISTARIPCAGIAIVDGVFSLGYQYTQNWNGTEQAQIIAGWGMAANGSNYGTLTAGWDPLINAQNDPSVYRGVPMLITSSAGDTHVPEQYNALAFEALVNGYDSVTHIEHTGNHGDDTGFYTPDFVGFFKKYNTAV